MNRFLTLGVIALMMVSTVWGNAVPTCPTGTATTSNYLNPDFTCTVLDKTFSDFSFAFIGGPPTISVTPDLTPLNPGLDFQLSGFSVNNGASEDIKLGFTVIDNSGPNIEDASLGIAGVTSTGAGSEVTIGETLCVGGTFSGAICSAGAGNEISLTVTDPPPSFSDHTLPFGPTGTVGVLKDISIVAGSSGVASLSIFSQNFSEIPEPAGMSFLLGAGLVGFGLLRNKFKKA